jgi:hypothetical protein
MFDVKRSAATGGRREKETILRLEIRVVFDP